MHARTLLWAGLVLAGTAQAAEMSIFKQPNFAGGETTFNRDTASLQGTGAYDQSKSVVVRSGRWQVCSQPNFQGDCQVLERGQYASLPQQLNGRIESLREVTQVADARSRWEYSGRDWRERADWRAEPRARAGEDNAYQRRYGYKYGSGGAISLFAEGNATRYDRDIDTLRGTTFEGGADRIVIREGTWEVCAQPGYRGICRTYEPGIYTNLGRFNTQIGSLRRIG